MTPERLTPERRSDNMRRIRATDTAIELLLRRALFREGIRGYRANPKTVRGKPDIAFIGKRIAVFVDGCFWHGCATCYVPPKTNAGYWAPKVERNQSRDREVTQSLQRDKWIVLRVWEHQIEDDLRSCVRRVKAALARRAALSLSR